MKTHWGGPSGWRDRQLPDGTIDWIAPDGQVYRTTPGSRLLFPELSAPTAPTHVNPADVPAANTTGLTMPKRRTTRDDDRERRIERERQLNALLEQDDAEDEAQREARRTIEESAAKAEADADADARADGEAISPPF